MPNITFDVTYPEVWSKYLAKNFDAESVMLPLVSRAVESDLKQFGDTVNVNKFGNVTIGNYTAGTNFNAQDLTMTSDQLILNQAKAFRFVIDKLESQQSHLDLVKGWVQRGMVAMAQTVDDRLFTHYANADAGNVVGSTSVPVTITPDNVYDYFVQMGQILDEDNIPMDNRVAVIDPGTKSAILKSPDFVRDTQKGDTVVAKATIGELAGFRVVVSNRITTVTNSKPLMFFGPEFIHFAMIINPNNVEFYKPEAQFGQGVKALAFYGSKVFNPTAGAVLHKAV